MTKVTSRGENGQRGKGEGAKRGDEEMVGYEAVQSDQNREKREKEKGRERKRKRRRGHEGDSLKQRGERQNQREEMKR